MWNKVKNIFKKNGVQTTPPVPTIKSEEDGRSLNLSASDNNSGTASVTKEQKPECVNIDAISFNGYPIATAIANLTEEYGLDFTASSAIVNALADYNAFSDKATQFIFKSLVSDGYFKQLTSLSHDSNWLNEANRISAILVNTYGFQEVKVKHTILEVLLGMGKCALEEISDIECTPDSYTEIPSPANSNVPYNPDVAFAHGLYELPSSDLFGIPTSVAPDEPSLQSLSQRLEWVLNGFGIKTLNISICPGFRYSMYAIEVEPKAIAKIARNEKDIITALGTEGIRIVNPLPNKMAIGIEIPNPDNFATISASDIFSSSAFKTSSKGMTLPIAMGFDSCANLILRDLSTLQNLLVCGSSQQGKTTFLHQLLASLLVSKTPSDIKFIIASANPLEYSDFKKLPWDFFATNIDEEYDIISERPVLYRTLKSIEEEISQRKKLFYSANIRNVEDYNSYFKLRQLNPGDGHRYLPHLIVIIDEFQFFFDGKSWDDVLSPLFESANGTGVHFVISSKNTTATNVTPLIRNYFQNKVVFRIGLSNESRLVLGNNYATNLLPSGDVLSNDNSQIIRCQTSNISTEDIGKLIDYINSYTWDGIPFILPEEPDAFSITPTSSFVGERDPLFEDVARYVVTNGNSSTSSVQRRFNIGYNRAGKIMDQLEACGIVGPASGLRPRDILVDSIHLEQILDNFNYGNL